MKLLRLSTTLALAVSLLATQAGAADAGGGNALNYTLIDLIKFGGWVGYLIILLSVVAVALVIEYALSIRQKALLPDQDIDRLRSLIAGGRYDDIVKDATDGEVSFVTTVVAAGVKERSRGYEAVVRAMENRADELTGRLLRKIEHLNMIANISPMLGLLGTVMGMVTSFNQISVAVGGVDPRRLAGGIFEALMTTVMGLIVAIPALYAFGIFRNRVDGLVAEATTHAEELVEPLKKL